MKSLKKDFNQTQKSQILKNTYLNLIILIINQICKVYNGEALTIILIIHQNKKLLKWKKIHGLQMH